MRSSDPAIDPLDRLETAVLQSARYRTVCPAIVRRIGARELAKRKTWKEAEQETRNRLHQIAGAYLGVRPPYPKWIAALRNAPDEAARRSELQRMMASHASTRERLPVIETFYLRAFETIRPVRSVLDVACGLNPLAVPWMGLEENACYFGCDLYSDMLDFLKEAVSRLPFRHSLDVRMEVRDLAAGPPEQEADVALILKLLPLLDLTEEQQTLKWLQRLRTRCALVSFPTRTLGGRNVGMAAAYESRFSEVIRVAGWAFERFELGSELCFLIDLTRGGTDTIS